VPIPDFREGACLPEGLHQATEAEVLFRFGSSNRRRRRQAIRLRSLLELARAVEALRCLLDGSFITAKPLPGDIDAVFLLPAHFEQLVQAEQEPALTLYAILTNRHPDDVFAAQDERDWLAWVSFFSRTREVDDRRKGLVEVLL
jgi:hypothetical protein